MKRPIKHRGITGSLLGGIAQYSERRSYVYMVSSTRILLKKTMPRGAQGHMDYLCGFLTQNLKGETRIDNIQTKVTFHSPFWFLRIIFYFICIFTMGNKNSQHNSTPTHLSSFFISYFCQLMLKYQNNEMSELMN